MYVYRQKQQEKHAYGSLWTNSIFSPRPISKKERQGHSRLVRGNYSSFLHRAFANALFLPFESHLIIDTQLTHLYPTPLLPFVPYGYIVSLAWPSVILKTFGCHLRSEPSSPRPLIQDTPMQVQPFRLSTVIHLEKGGLWSRAYGCKRYAVMWCLGEQSAQAKCPNIGKGEAATSSHWKSGHLTSRKTISKQQSPKPWSGV